MTSNNNTFKLVSLASCCACLCGTILLAIAIAILVQVNHISHELAAEPTPAPTAVAAINNLAAAGRANNVGLQNARATLLSNGAARHAEAKRDVAEARAFIAAVPAEKVAPKRALSIGERRAAALRAARKQ
jgi:hypothetical protein